jgi:hypothetical protein
MNTPLLNPVVLAMNAALTMLTHGVNEMAVALPYPGSVSI